MGGKRPLAADEYDRPATANPATDRCAGNPPADIRIADLADRQHGVVARRQLVELGLGARAIEHRLSAGRLHLLHRGVYSVGVRQPATRGLWLATTLACGPQAHLSHRAAAALWSLVRAPSGRIDVTVGGQAIRGRPGIAVHRIADPAPTDFCRKEGIPVTGVARTIVDMASISSARQLERLLEQAEIERSFDLRAIREVMSRSTNYRGRGSLARLLGRLEAPQSTRSELERRFLDLCRDADMPRPLAGATVAGLEVDMLWKRERLVVELDGFRYHGIEAAFERDRKRDATLQKAGLRVIRVTARRLRDERRELVGDLRELLAATPDDAGSVGRVRPWPAASIPDRPRPVNT